MLKKVRIDKWLWSVRIFKSRTLSTTACKAGRVTIGEKSVKPSFLVERDMEIIVRKNGFHLHFKVIDLLEKRVGAPIAITCYDDLTPAEELSKYKDWFVGKGGAETRGRGLGRPTKRERRDLDKFKDDFYNFED